MLHRKQVHYACTCGGVVSRRSHQSLRSHATTCPRLRAHASTAAVAPAATSTSAEASPVDQQNLQQTPQQQQQQQQQQRRVAQGPPRRRVGPPGFPRRPAHPQRPPTAESTASQSLTTPISSSSGHLASSSPSTQLTVADSYGTTADTSADASAGDGAAADIYSAAAADQQLPGQAATSASSSAAATNSGEEPTVRQEQQGTIQIGAPTAATPAAAPHAGVQGPKRAGPRRLGPPSLGPRRGLPVARLASKPAAAAAAVTPAATTVPATTTTGQQEQQRSGPQQQQQGSLLLPPQQQQHSQPQQQVQPEQQQQQQQLLLLQVMPELPTASIAAETAGSSSSSSSMATDSPHSSSPSGAVSDGATAAAVEVRQLTPAEKLKIAHEAMRRAMAATRTGAWPDVSLGPGAQQAAGGSTDSSTDSSSREAASNNTAAGGTTTVDTGAISSTNSSTSEFVLRGQQGNTPASADSTAAVEAAAAAGGSGVGGDAVAGPSAPNSMADTTDNSSSSSIGRSDVSNRNYPSQSSSSSSSSAQQELPGSSSSRRRSRRSSSFVAGAPHGSSGSSKMSGAVAEEGAAVEAPAHDAGAITPLSTHSMAEGVANSTSSSTGGRRRRRSSTTAGAAAAAASDPAVTTAASAACVPAAAETAGAPAAPAAAADSAVGSVDLLADSSQPTASQTAEAQQQPTAEPTQQQQQQQQELAEAAAAATVPSASRRVRTVGDSRAPSGMGLKASAVEHLLAKQRELGAASRRAAGGKAAGSRSSRGGSSTQLPGIYPQQNGRFGLVGFEADARALDSLLPALQERLTSGVQAEQQQEQAAIKKLYAAGSLRQLQKDGVVLLQLQAAPSHVLYSSMVWRFSPGGGGRPRDLPYHRFRQGDSLLISRFSEEELVEVSAANSRSYGISRASVDRVNDLRPGSKDFRALDATVVEVRKDHLLLALEKSDSDRMQQELQLAPAAALVSWRLDQSVRDTTARRQLEAIKKLSQPTTDSPFEALLRMVLVGTSQGAVGAEVPPEWARDADWRKTVKQLLEKTEGLNNSQRKAISLAVLRTFTLWQGPPGTGKTRTLLAMVEVLVKAGMRNPQCWATMGPILACGDTNAAVDNLVEGLVNRKLRVVRLGQPAKVRAHLQQYTLEAQAERTPDGQKAVLLRQDSKALFERAKQLADGAVLPWGNQSRSTPELIRSGRARSSSTAKGAVAAAGSSEGLEKQARRKWAEAESLSKRAAQQVLQEAQVVCATCSGAGDPLLNNLHFNMVVIDEATQATEPATLVPLTQGARSVVMAGDPAQLPPTVTSQEAAQQHGLRVTLFERLQRVLGLKHVLLDTQYRMNPAISAFPSHQFYAGKLKDGVGAAEKPAAGGVSWPQPDLPVMFVEVQGIEEQAKKSKAKAADGSDVLLYGADAAAAAGGLMEASYRNLQEARVALQAVYALMTAGDAETAAILTPYKGQVRAFEHALRVLSPWFTPDLMTRLTVSSIDGYQGREADVVLFSAVRCNKQGRIGFVSDRRRLNVGITRPRRGLIVVGSPETLEKGSEDWKAFLDWCRERQWVTRPNALPAAPWQQEGVDPFTASAVTSSWSSAESVDSL